MGVPLRARVLKIHSWYKLSMFRSLVLLSCTDRSCLYNPTGTLVAVCMQCIKSAGVNPVVTWTVSSLCQWWICQMYNIGILLEGRVISTQVKLIHLLHYLQQWNICKCNPPPLPNSKLQLKIHAIKCAEFTIKICRQKKKNVLRYVSAVQFYNTTEQCGESMTCLNMIRKC